MSTHFPNLTKHQLFQSHLVNCQICSKYEYASVTVNDQMEGFGKGWEIKTKVKVNRRMCKVGVKLFNEALKEDPSKSPFRPKSFPYVAKIFERVRFRPKGKIEWIQGNVIDRSIGSNGQVIGYEVEVTKKAVLEGAPDRKSHYYVNPLNIKPLVTWQEKQDAIRSSQPPRQPITPGKYKFSVGGETKYSDPARGR